MLSYRHAFHAGNYADVLKHFVFCEVLAYFQQKPTGFLIVDTHAGAGRYALDSAYASKNKEYQTGIAKLLGVDLPPPVQRYVDLIRQWNTGDQLTRYSGSPWLALAHLRPQDQLCLFELHTRDYALLATQFSRYRHIKLMCADGYAGLAKMLPPATRRAVVLIDPPFEQATDYVRVEQALKLALRRFATATYLVWYPCIRNTQAMRLPNTLKSLAPKWLHVQLTVAAEKEQGLWGCGVFVINPPWTLPATLERCMPVLRDLLAQDETARSTIELALN